jgi:hypothetical protein
MDPTSVAPGSMNAAAGFDNGLLDYFGHSHAHQLSEF